MAFENVIRRVDPYVPGEQPKVKGIIKLNTNENPYAPAEGVIKAIEDLDKMDYTKYPDPEVSLLVHALAEYHGLDDDQVFVGVGSDDVISMSFLTFFNSGKPVFFPDITYSFYDVWANLYRIPFETKALTEDFRINPEDYKGENGGIIFPNPNAPTGMLESLDMIEDIVKANPDVICIVDEAYIDFGGETCLPLLDKYPNLLVVRTYSKSRSMAGMRIGYMCGSRELIKAINDVKFSFNSYTMNATSIVAGVASVEAEEYFRENIDKVIKTREWTKKELTRLGFEFPDSYANFIFAKHATVSGKDIFEALKAENIFVRHFNKPRINDYLRISIGTDEQMKTLIEKLEKIVK